ncbi:histidinol-phosphate aminotransferase [Bacillus oleivorans]|uniref:Histidinol-phosphate aminotransferase n=1 Tax=Bacillus oleivorans TaxID=1448271 RepID=A0A285CT46_9BACI|nr:histidinol-phosphate transaminase [Bacillus oleivorans]SNX70692.1 histidinol-phosphate aminotransferase [Bacillus oleivorans]
MKIEQLVREVYPNLMPYTSKLADLPVEEIKKVLGKERVFKLSFNENPLGPSPKAIEAMQQAIRKLNLYPSSTGALVQQKIAEMEEVLPENIILSNGADEMITMVAQTYLDPGDEVIIPEVTFVQYFASAHLMGAKPVLAPMKEDLGIDLQAILDRITTKTKLICLCNPNNPTGAVIRKQELVSFFQQLPDHVIVVIDEAYHEYAGGPEYFSSIPFVKENYPVFVIRTFSKIYSMAAARLGYGIGPVPIVNAIHQVRSPFNVNSVAQAGAVASLKDQEHVEQALKINEAGKNLLYKAFEELGFTYIKSHGNFVYVNTGYNSGELFTQLAEQYGIIVRNLSGYGLTTSLRISVGTEDELQALIQALYLIFEK